MTREKFIEAAGGIAAAVEFESACLSVGTEFMPAHAVRVRDGGDSEPGYWEWLIQQLENDARDADDESGFVPDWAVSK